MKPVSLNIAGLNSFRQSTPIDFTELLQDGLFGIFGPTGSGKSTILDAITLALYGKVRRAPNGTHGIINMAERQCSVSLAFDVGTAGNRRRYSVERRLARARTGGVETKAVRLIEYGAEGPIPRAEKIIEVRDRIQEIIGIGHEDFQRAVVLPQGAFAEFLGLEKNERNAMLERLFGLHDLGMRLNQMLRERAQDLALRRAEVDARLQELRAYDDDALQTCRLRAEEATQARVEARALLEAALERRSQADALLALLDERDALVADEAARAADAERAEGLRREIFAAERSAAVMPSMAALDGAEELVRSSQDHYDRALRTKDENEAALDVIRVVYDRAHAAYGERYERLGKEIAALEGIRTEKEQLKAQLSRLDELRRSLADAQAQLQASLDERASLADVLSGIDGEHASASASIEATHRSADERERLAALGTIVERLRVGEVEADRLDAERAAAERAAATAADAAQRAAGEIADCQERLQRLRVERTGLQESALAAESAKALAAETAQHLERSLIDAERAAADIHALTSELAHMAERAAAQQAVAEAARRHRDTTMAGLATVLDERAAALRRRDDLHRDLVMAALVADLGDDDHCPLCGSKDHPSLLAIEGGTADELTAAIAGFDGAEESMRAAQARVSEAEVAVATSTAEATSLAGQSDACRVRCSDASERLAAALVAAGAFASIDALRAASETARRELEDASVHIRDRSQALAVNEKALTAASDGANTVSASSATLATEAATAREREQQLAERLKQLRARLEQDRTTFAGMSGGESIDAVDAHLQLLRDQDRAADAAREALRRIADRRSPLAARAEEIERLVAQQEPKAAALRADVKALEELAQQRREELQRRFEELVPAADRGAGERVEEILGRREQEQASIRETYEREQQRYNEAQAAARTALHLVEEYWTRLCTAKRDRDTADRTCAAVAAEQGFAHLREARAAFRSPQDLTALREDVRRLESALLDVQRRLAEVTTRIAGRGLTRKEHAEAVAAHEAAGSAFEEAVRIVGDAEGMLRTCREKNVEWNAVRHDDAFVAEGAATADQLMKYLRGNGFIDFLANERLADVCRRASTQLAELTAGRFHILSRPSDGFIIRDFANGGGERSPNSLSGGETFLVSLSLALALSDTIQVGHAPLEFFFLDEGFGTLDEELLEVAMTTLERLRSKHRAIGVISHVAQLRERISRRLVVSPPTDAAGSNVRFELG